MQMLRLPAIFLVAVVAASGPANAQDAASGEKVFLACRACHQVGPAAKNGVAPVLNGLIGRAAGSSPGYAYSAAMKGSGLTWDEPTFREFIQNPKAKVPGTKMAYPGIKDEQKVSDLVAYLKQFDATGQKQ